MQVSTYRSVVHPARTPRPRIDDAYRTSAGRRGAGIVLADVSDEDILKLLDDGLTRVEIAAHLGVEPHIIRYRLYLRRASQTQKAGTKRIRAEVIGAKG